MRYKHPRAKAGYSGGFGGVGSRPAPKTWMPGSGKPSRVRSRVAEKFRRLRLRPKSKRDEYEAGDAGPPARDLALGALLLVCALGALLATASDIIPWTLGPLLFLMLAAGGGMFLGRGISKLQVRRRAADPEAERTRIAAPSTWAIVLARAQGWALLLSGFAAWFLLGLPYWGSFHPLKAVAAVALFLGLGISFNVGNPYRNEGSRSRPYVPGRHAARAQSWSVWRRCIAVGTGSLLIAVGMWQDRGHGAEPGADPLRSILCLILACAVGIPLIGIALSKRREPKHTL